MLVFLEVTKYLDQSRRFAAGMSKNSSWSHLPLEDNNLISKNFLHRMLFRDFCIVLLYSIWPFQCIYWELFILCYIVFVCMLANECFTTLPLTVFTQRNFVADFLQAKCNFFTQIGRFAFLRPPLGDLGATYDDHLRLIGKRIVDSLLALIQLFSLVATAEELRAIIGWKSAISLQRGPVDQKFQEEGVAPTNHSSSNKTRLNVLSYGI